MNNLLCLLTWLILASLTLPAFCASTPRTQEETAKAIAQKDYESARTKIQLDDKAAMDKCAKYQGSSASACVIQAHGKRVRAEEEAKATVERAGRTPPLPDAEAKSVAKHEIAKAKDDNKATNKKISEERNAAIAECSKLKGTERKACTQDVDARRAEAMELANAIYKKSVQNAKALMPP